jgi:hypothetical protein
VQKGYTVCGATARQRRWHETGTAHEPGIQPADVKELLEHGADVVVLSKGVMDRLQICPETLETLTSRVVAHVLQTEVAVRLYNELRRMQRVEGLFHSTC